MADLDQRLKQLLRGYVEDVAALAVQGMTILSSAPTDMAATRQLIADSLYHARFEDIACLANIEIQAYPESSMARRSFDYAMRARDIHGLPVISIILYLKKKGTIPDAYYVERIGTLEIGRWRTFPVEIYRLDASSMVQTAALGILPLIPFMQGASMDNITGGGETH